MVLVRFPVVVHVIVDVPVVLMQVPLVQTVQDTVWKFRRCSSLVSVTCSIWFLPEEYSTCLFWEKTSGYVVFCASWFDSGYIFMPVYVRCGCCFTAQFLVLSGTCYASVTELAVTMHLSLCSFLSSFGHRCLSPVWTRRSGTWRSAKNSDFPQLQFIAGRRFPCRGAEADSRGLDVQQTVEFLQLQFIDKVFDVSVVQVQQVPVHGGRCPCCAGRSLPVVVHDRRAWFRLCGNSWRCCSCSSFTVMDVPLIMHMTYTVSEPPLF